MSMASRLREVRVAKVHETSNSMKVPFLALILLWSLVSVNGAAVDYPSQRRALLTPTQAPVDEKPFLTNIIGGLLSGGNGDETTEELPPETNVTDTEPQEDGSSANEEATLPPLSAEEGQPAEVGSDKELIPMEESESTNTEVTFPSVTETVPVPMEGDSSTTSEEMLPDSEQQSQESIPAQDDEATNTEATLPTLIETDPVLMDGDGSTTREDMLQDSEQQSQESIPAEDGESTNTEATLSPLTETEPASMESDGSTTTREEMLPDAPVADSEPQTQESTTVGDIESTSNEATISPLTETEQVSTEGEGTTTKEATVPDEQQTQEPIPLRDSESTNNEATRSPLTATEQVSTEGEDSTTRESALPDAAVGDSGQQTKHIPAEDSESAGNEATLSPLTETKQVSTEGDGSGTREATLPDSTVADSQQQTPLQMSPSPTGKPTSPRTATPTDAPTASPTSPPTEAPTGTPTATPTPRPTSTPTSGPTSIPTAFPTSDPTAAPTSTPTASPTSPPTPMPTGGPTSSPTSSPTASPTFMPTGDPTSSPSSSPTASPTSMPTGDPTSSPSSSPTAYPTSMPTGDPTSSPSSSPTGSPTSMPSESPTANPTANPTPAPTDVPSASPTSEPTNSPTKSPTANPTMTPTSPPTEAPSSSPTTSPSSTPTSSPSSTPSRSPTGSPSGAPSTAPSPLPTATPTTEFEKAVLGILEVNLSPVSDAMNDETIGVFEKTFESLLMEQQLDSFPPLTTVEVDVLSQVLSRGRRLQSNEEARNQVVMSVTGSHRTGSLPEFHNTLANSINVASESIVSALQATGDEYFAAIEELTAEATSLPPGFEIDGDKVVKKPPPATAIPEAPRGEGLNGGAIAGIVIACVVGLGAALFILKKSGRNQIEEGEHYIDEEQGRGEDVVKDIEPETPGGVSNYDFSLGDGLPKSMSSSSSDEDPDYMSHDYTGTRGSKASGVDNAPIESRGGSNQGSGTSSFSSLQYTLDSQTAGSSTVSDSVPKVQKTKLTDEQKIKDMSDDASNSGSAGGSTTKTDGTGDSMSDESGNSPISSGSYSTGASSALEGENIADGEDGFEYEHIRRPMKRKKRVMVPPGKIGVSIESVEGGPIVTQIKAGSPLEGKVTVGDQIIGIDEIDATQLTAIELTKIVMERFDQERTLELLYTEA